LGLDDALAPERDLAVQFGVSRHVIREALGRLKGLGLLHARSKWGTRLKSCSWSETLGAQIASLVTDERSRDQMFDLRMSVELGNAIYIVDKITDEQVADLRNQLNRMMKARTAPELEHLDAEFHVKLLQVSENPLIVEFAGVIVNYFKTINDLDRENAGRFALPPKESTRERHEPIIEALVARDKSKLIRAMTQHVSGFKKQL
jgi:DNA-binding FadR family transcriptional regulator